MGGAGRIAAHQNLVRAGIVGVGPVAARQRLQRPPQHRDVVGGGIAAGIPGSQQPGQRFPIGDLRTVQKRQQRMMTPGLLPGRGRAFLVVGMVDRDGGIDIDMQPLTRRRRRPASPRRRTGVRAGGSDTGQVCRVDAGIDQPPHRGRGRRGAKGVFPIPAPLPDAVDAVRPGGHRRGQIGEHRTRLIHPRTSIRVGQRGGDLRRQAGQIRHLPHHAHPGMRHDTMTVRGHFTRATAAIFFTCEVPSRQHYGTLSSPIMPCRTGTFAYVNPQPRSFAKNPG